MESFQKLHEWHQTKVGLVVFGLLELVLAYIIGSKAIDTANLWEYALTILLIIGAIHNFVKAIILTSGKGKKRS